MRSVEGEVLTEIAPRTAGTADTADTAEERPLTKRESAALLASVVRDEMHPPDVRIRAFRALMDYDLIEDGPEGVGRRTQITRYQDDPDNPDAYVDVIEELGTGVYAPIIFYVVPDSTILVDSMLGTPETR